MKILNGVATPGRQDSMSLLTTQGTTRAWLWVFCFLVAVMLCAGEGITQTSRRQSKANQPESGRDTRRVRDFSSRNFLVHTDLAEAEANDLLDRLETMLRLISRYWGRPNKKTIECFVVVDLRNWPPGSLDPAGRAYIRSGGGLTVTTVAVRGTRFDAKAIVYAIADRGTAQHEAVHAYCAQAFGRGGPIWYAEGMAEMGQYWREDDHTVRIDDRVLAYLQRAEPKSLNEIVNAREVTGDSWQNYAWRWALCHLLANNPNYRDRFRPLGLGLLTGQDVSFNAVYGSLAPEISFEYLFFLEHVEQGYDVTQCSWDWKARFRAVSVRRGATSKIKADYGWQPSRVLAQDGTSYTYTVIGTWKTDDVSEAVDADGHPDGRGTLMGVVFSADYELSDPFELGTEGTWSADRDGSLFLRCRDGWGELGNNTGRVTVKFTAQEKPGDPE